MDTEMRNLLILLGFSRDLQIIPPLTVVKQQFRKQSLLKYPDKPSGDKRAFQELHQAYSKIVRDIQKTGNAYEEDSWDEETLKRNYFKEYSLYGN